MYSGSACPSKARTKTLRPDALAARATSAGRRPRPAMMPRGWPATMVAISCLGCQHAAGGLSANKLQQGAHGRRGAQRGLDLQKPIGERAFVLEQKLVGLPQVIDVFPREAPSA